MNRAKRFDLLLQLADERDQEAARALATHRASMEEAQAKLQSLLSYRDDYANGLKGGTRPGLGIEVRNYLQFLSQLNRAIDEQERSVERHRGAVTLATQRWQETQKEIAVLGKVTERMRQADLHETDRRDQKLIDELAGARHQRRGGFKSN
jgi:flagellar FliJ protein